MADVIKHRGVIQAINGSHVVVRIVQTSACSACSVKGHCNASESKDKLVDVYGVKLESYHVGEEVIVCGTTSMGMRAVVLAFGVPFLVLILALLLALSLTDGDELLSAVVALLALIPYYLLIYLCRDKLSKRFSFMIETINN